MVISLMVQEKNEFEVVKPDRVSILYDFSSANRTKIPFSDSQVVLNDQLHVIHWNLSVSENSVIAKPFFGIPLRYDLRDLVG